MGEPQENIVEKVVTGEGMNPWRRVLKGLAIVLVALFMLLTGTIFCLRWVNPPVTAFVLQQNWEELNVDRYNLRDAWVDYDKLPNHLQWAVVASEDQRFWEHWGLDLVAIEVALEERREGTRERGASTISQQVAKNLFLSPAQSFIRKGVEAGITVLIELFWPKERILEVYLNIVEFGPGVFGIGMATDSFFGVEASRLMPEQSARLAAVLPSPKRMRVEPPSPYTMERSRWILRQMTQLSGVRYLPGPDREEDFELQPPESEKGMQDPENNLPTPELPDSNDGVADPELPDSVDGLELPDSEPDLPDSDTSSTDSLSVDVPSNSSTRTPSEWQAGDLSVI